MGCKFSPKISHFLQHPTLEIAWLARVELPTVCHAETTGGLASCNSGGRQLGDPWRRWIRTHSRAWIEAHRGDHDGSPHDELVSPGEATTPRQGDQRKGRFSCNSAAARAPHPLFCMAAEGGMKDEKATKPEATDGEPYEYLRASGPFNPSWRRPMLRSASPASPARHGPSCGLPPRDAWSTAWLESRQRAGNCTCIYQRRCSRARRQHMGSAHLVTSNIRPPRHPWGESVLCTT